ncbi:MAG: TerD family protein [Treponema sp.]|jgi:stress response protein SCP2|nr:TerD family protein [Treponema sp.]
MAVNLQKGQRISLAKEDGSALHNVTIGLGWDVSARAGVNVDCDASAVLCGQNDKMINADLKTGDIVFFNHLKHSSGAVWHTGDNLTGAGEGDDEQIVVLLDKVPAQYEKIIFTVTLYEAKKRNQHFGLLKNAFIRIVDSDSQKELCNYQLSEQYDGMTMLIFGELYRKDGVWKFNAIGQPTHDEWIADLVRRYS